jgi:hypothetical protein
MDTSRRDEIVVCSGGYRTGLTACTTRIGYDRQSFMFLKTSIFTGSAEPTTHTHDAMDFSIGDDDDAILEQQVEDYEAYETHIESSEAPKLSAEERSAAAADSRATASQVTPADFELLPYCAELVRAHQQGDGAQVVEQKLWLVRRAVRRAETRFNLIAAAAGSADPEAAQSLLDARTELLERVTRKRGRSCNAAPS